MKTTFWFMMLLLSGAVFGLSFLGQAPSPSPEILGSPPEGPPDLRWNRGSPAVHGRRGVYLPAPIAADPATLAQVLAQTQKFGLNAVVVDVKNNNGEVCYASQVPLAQSIGAVRPSRNLSALVAELHRRGIYVIARQVVFYAPLLARHLGLSTSPWVLPPVEVAQLGVDEIQFDYVRFPDDGPIGPDYSLRGAAVEAFLAQAKTNLALPISVDLFGRVLWPWMPRGLTPSDSIWRASPSTWM